MWCSKFSNIVKKIKVQKNLATLYILKTRKELKTLQHCIYKNLVALEEVKWLRRLYYD